MVFGSRTLAIVAITTTLVSCSSPELPATSDLAIKERVRIYSTTSAQPLARDLAALQLSETWGLVEVEVGNHDVLLDRLITNEDGILLTSTFKAADGLWAAPIARDGIAIIVNASVSISELSIDQLRAIYQGRISDWGQLGGASHRIVIVSREIGSDVRYEFEAMVMGTRLTTAGAILAASSQQMIDYVADVPGAIGYVSFGLVDDSLKIMAVDGVLPDVLSISEQIYPLRTTIYLTGVGQPDAEVEALLNWLQSSDGQEIVKGYFVPINVLQDFSD